jgi:hypothetical protein
LDSPLNAAVEYDHSEGGTDMTIAERAKAIYEAELKDTLEATHFGQFLAIEPQSRDYFVDPVAVQAALAAKRAHRDRRSFMMRIGSEAAFHIGASTK